VSATYVWALKAFVEGSRDLAEWPAWWRENATCIREAEGPTLFLKVKLQWREGAIEILEEHGIPFIPDPQVNWARCKTCGEPLFHVEPKVTTREQIRDFAARSNLPERDAIVREGWLHPGAYCPNGCTAVLVSYDSGQPD
jgi:hypothetical protein